MGFGMGVRGLGWGLEWGLGDWDGGWGTGMEFRGLGWGSRD